MNAKQALIGVLFACAGASAIAAQSKAACSFNMPSLWSDRTAQWNGACQDGLAQGAGVLRASPHPQRPQEPIQLFFGEMNRGNPVLGVIDTPEGFIAGRFTAGRIDADADRSTLIEAFKIAASAARAASNRYKAAGNEASARFYATRAHEMDRQLD